MLLVLSLGALDAARAAEPPPVAAAETPPVAAAATLEFALPEVVERFRHDTGRSVRLSFGSSGNFKNQILQRAPFELFLSADEDMVVQLADAGMTVDRGVLYAVGRIVLFAPNGSPLAVDDRMQGLKQALAEGRIARFAIANPDHAPYGRAARAALTHAGLWPAIAPKLVMGENAAQAMQFAASGSTQGGIVPLALSKAPAIARLGRFATLPAEWHADEPLRQRMVLLKNAGTTARAFYEFLQQPSARAILSRYGFLLPGQSQ
jgi:molybdate transport system substrate-binding protein